MQKYKVAKIAALGVAIGMASGVASAATIAKTDNASYDVYGSFRPTIAVQWGDNDQNPDIKDNSSRVGLHLFLIPLELLMMYTATMSNVMIAPFST